MRKKVTTLNKNDVTMEQVVKRKRNRPDLQQFGYELAEPGDNSKATMFIQALNKFDRVDLSDENAVKQRIDEFWQLCIDFDTKPQVSGMADVLGLDRRRLWEITHDVVGRNLECSSATRDLIKKEYRKLEVLWEYGRGGCAQRPGGMIGSDTLSLFPGSQTLLWKQVSELVGDDLAVKADGSVVGTFHHVTDTPSSVLSRTSKKVITFRFT